MKVACVLRASADYDVSRVERLARQLSRRLPEAQLFCLSDVDVPAPVERIPLRSRLPGWWAKMELFAPWVTGDFLYLDLDTTLVGDLTDIAQVRTLTLLRDFYYPQHAASGMMFLPEADRPKIWEVFSADPVGWVREYQSVERQQARGARWGDQAFLADHGYADAQRWQDAVPDQVVSYKAQELATRGLPPGARVICFHGQPRPWDPGVPPEFQGD
jgi:hypothetical protein